MDNLKDIVKQLYTECFTVANDSNPSEVMDKILANNFKSINSSEVKNKDQLIQQIQGIRKLIPNLTWEIQEMLTVGNRVIVRCIATGNPNGNFFGIQVDGSKAFRIMSIDIHTVENNQVVEVYHVEEWATAMKQLM